MDAFPHHYTVTASGDTTQSQVTVSSSGVPDIATNAPAEFGGPGDQWSPEALLMAAVADCFVLSFRAIATASKVEWTSISCKATGTLDRIDRKALFTEIALDVSASAPDSVDEAKLDKLLHKAEESCLITNSMSATVTLNTEVNIG